jgi:hypothetical protein
MNAQMVLNAGAREMNDLSQPCQILVLSEDVLTYGRAMYVCQRVLGQFAEQMDFNFHCWNFRQQTDDESIQKTLQIAGQADIIILSLGGLELAPILQEWLQVFAESRSHTQGALALVLGPPAEPLTEIQKLADQIQAVCDQVGMDFVPLMPENSTGIFPPPRSSREPGQYPERTHYDHWGLNE